MREKRKYAIKFAKDLTAENFALIRKYRNIATRERRKAIRAYWHTQSQELNARPDRFYSTFKPFVSNKTKESTEVSLKSEESKIVKNQTEVTEMLANYFTNAASSIGGNHVNNLTEEDHDDHKSVKAIREAYEGMKFEFK